MAQAAPLLSLKRLTLPSLFSSSSEKCGGEQWLRRWLIWKLSCPVARPWKIVFHGVNTSSPTASDFAHRNLLCGLLKAQDEERRRLARELHDSTAQKLAAIIIGLNLLEDELNTPHMSKARGALREILTTAEVCAEDVRTLSARLYPPLLDALGLEAALEVHIQGLQKHHGLQVTLEIKLPGETLHQDIALTLYRVVHESIAHGVLPSGASTAVVRVQRSEDQFVLEIAFDGRAKEPVVDRLQPAHTNPVCGMRALRERLSLLGGTLEMEMEMPSQQPCIRARVPQLL